MSRSLVAVVFVLTALHAGADLFTELDALHEGDNHQQILQRIEREIPAADRSRHGELLWRKARAQLTLADYGRWQGELSDRETIDRLEAAERSATEAIELAPETADPYFWKAATIGLRGQVRGVLNSLFLASSVRDYAEKTLERNSNHTEAHYLLGQLYRELPRRPLSFGNRDHAVRYARRSVELHEREYRAGTVGVRYYDLYTQLAASLWQRNNSGDRDEARELLRSIVRDLQSLSAPTTRERKDLESARELLDRWR